MISSNDFKRGMTIEVDGAVWVILESMHVKPGKGQAFVRTKLRNIKTESTVERTFRAGEKVAKAHIDKRAMQYLYVMDDQYYFMDTDSYEQFFLSEEYLGDQVLYLKENMVIDVMMYDGAVIGVELPSHINLEVVETEPGIKGDTVSGASKPAKLETGATVQVPLFVNVGDVIRVDTRTATYIERV